ncbi:hypothetical protein Ciccas_004555 [Cichlidogyrus casuarinus]|uniref:Uncharacterized protein n=1 Tax=Cichlidogyrus casuarinus TaxID=1844966 RepID=A0ABD2QB66_9PLAT
MARVASNFWLIIEYQIRDWIEGPGIKLLRSQTAKPNNFEEALEIRKNHEQFEFKCVVSLAEKALEGYAEVLEARKASPNDQDLCKIDMAVQNYVELLNQRTMKYVAKSAVDTNVLKLKNSLSKLDKEYNPSELQSKEDIFAAIDLLNSNAKDCEIHFKSLSYELERLEKILVNQSLYLKQLEDLFSASCVAASEGKQISQLRRLVLTKELKLAECKSSIDESLSWLDTLNKQVVSLYNESSVGRSLVESWDLQKRYALLIDKANATQQYSSELIDTFSQMSSSSNSSNSGRFKNKLDQQKSQLDSISKQVFERSINGKKRSEAAIDLYKNLDDLLELAEHHFIALQSQPDALSDANQSLLNKRFDLLQQDGIALLDKIGLPLSSSEVQSIFTPNIDETRQLIKIKFYTLYVKLCQLDQGSKLFRLSNPLLPDWNSLTASQRQTLPPAPALPRRPRDAMDAPDGALPPLQASDPTLKT